MGSQPTLFRETPEEIYARVYRELRPRARMPRIEVEFRRFANPDSRAQMADDVLRVRISDLLEGAPGPVLEALAYLLLGKLLRKTVSRVYAHRYKLYLSRKEMRRSAHLVRQIRGRKFLSGPQGARYHLEEIFEELNARHFDGLLARPNLGWSRRPSRTTLGHFDPSHNAIILSKLLDEAAVPRFVLEYVLYHEMLHLRFPIEQDGVRRRIHTAEFRRAERTFPLRKEAKQWLRKPR